MKTLSNSASMNRCVVLGWFKEPRDVTICGMNIIAPKCDLEMEKK
jgi:hypothetical protein